MVEVHYCYLLVSEENNRLTYIGYTTNLDKRLKQHNGELVGGAKATRKAKDWHIHAYVSFESKQEAMSFEWLWKHEKRNGKWYRTKPGIENKMKRLNEINEMKGGVISFQ